MSGASPTATLLGTIAATLLAVGCAGSKPQSATHADRLARSGDLVAADLAYEQALEEPLAHDEWTYVRDQLCATRRARGRAALAEPAGRWPDAVINDLRAQIRRCPELVGLDNKLAAVLLERNLARLEELQPVIDRGELWAALAAAAPAWAALPPENPRRAWFADLRERASQQLAAQADRWRVVPLAAAIFDELAWLAGTSAASIRGNPRATIDARLAGRRVSSTAQTSAECAVWFGSAIQGAVATPVDPEDAAIEITLTGCRETLALIAATETYTEYEEREVTVTKMVPVMTSVSVPHSTVSRSCTPAGDTFQSCTDYTTTTYETRQESILVPSFTKELQQVAVQRERPIKRLQRTFSASAAIHVRFADGEARDTATRQSTVVAGRFEASATSPGSSAGLFPDQDRLLGLELAEAAEAAVAAQLHAHHSARWLALARAARAANEVNAAVDAFLTVRLGNPAPDGEGADFLGATLGLPAATFAPYAPPNLRAIEQRSEPLRAEAYKYVASHALRLQQLGYASLTGYMGLQGQRGPEIVGQPTRNGVRGVYEMRLDLVGAVRQDPLGIGAIVPAAIRIEVGRRTSDAYVYPMPNGSFVTEEGGWDAGLDLSAGLLVGYRGHRLGAFVGVLAAYQGQVLGSYHSSSGQLPFAARLELRIRERRPILVDLWGQDLRGGDEYTRGARIDLPIGEARWLSAALRETRAESQTRGLSDMDYVALGARSLFSASLGVVFGF